MAYIYSNPYKATYLAAKQELEQRVSELDFVTRRIEQLKESIRTLEPLANEEGVAPTAGLSEMCGQILQRLAMIGINANDVIQALKFQGVDVSGYSNPLAVIHTTLTRLCKPGSGFVKIIGPHGPLYCFDESKRTKGFIQQLVEGSGGIGSLG